MIGQRLGHFEILEKLGEGGMGAVYKARDVRLDRLVAIKVLRAGWTHDADRRRRFLIEARAASNLNHPSIVTIHDIGQQDDIDFIAMEYVQGRTLDALIARRGLPTNDALRYGVQIADAVAAAHALGIVHRDLKPSNIMVTGQGQVKVLDFGLAKITGSVLKDDAASTWTSPSSGQGTVDGAILGTFAYMSPEQADGKAVDERSDIFSFGVNLYEMVSGKRPFEGSSSVSTLAAILHKDPAPLSGLVADLDPGYEKIVQRCLRKDPERRYQSMKECRIALEELRDESASNRAAATAAAMLSRREPKPRRRLWLMGAAVGLALAAAGAWYARRLLDRPASYRLRQITADRGLTTTPALSADGRMLVYASDRATGKDLDLWLHPLTAGGRPIRLTSHPADDVAPSFTPDGGQVVFHSSRDGGGIYVMGALGGGERMLVRGGGPPRVSPDGQWVAYASGAFLRDSKIMVVPLQGGEARVVGGEVPWADNPTWSPDSKSIAFVGLESANDPRMRSLWAAPLNGRARLVAKTGNLPPESQMEPEDWVGDSLVLRNGFELITYRISGNKPAVRLLAATAQPEFARARATADTASPPQIVFASIHRGTRLWSLPIEANRARVLGPMTPVSNEGGSMSQPALSADGSRMVYTYRDPAGSQVRLVDTKSGKETVLYEGLARPKISPDGSQVVYDTRREIFLQDASGGAATVLTGFPPAPALYGWTADGRSLVFWHGSPIRFALYDLKTRQSRDILSHPQHSIHGADVSPDGRWVVFHIPGPAREPLYIAPVKANGIPAPEEWIQIAGTTGLNRRGLFSPDGNTVYYVSQRDGSLCLWAQPLDPATKRARGEPVAVQHFHDAIRSSIMLGQGVLTAASTQDRLVLSLPEISGDIWLAEAIE